MTRILPAILALFLIPLAAGQDEAFEEALAGLKQAQKEKIPADQIHFAKAVAEKWEAADEKQRKYGHKYAKKNLSSRDRDVREATVDALTKMTGGKRNKWGDSATKLLVAQRKLKTTEKDITYFGQVLDAIGLVGHPKGIKPLTDLLKYKDYDIVGAAGLALGHYKDAELAHKKEIVKEILKMYTSISNQARDPKNSTARKRLSKINKPFETTLRALSGRQDQNGADAWQRWWNNEGKKARKWS